MKSINWISCVVVIGITSGAALGCSKQKDVSPFPGITKEERALINAKVDCSTAPQDIQTLQNEKASVGEKILDGVSSILPISAVADLLMGDYSARLEVASGQYNRDIETKIDEIKSICGISE